jgi:ribose transport system substrate-binding protein
MKKMLVPIILIVLAAIVIVVVVMRKDDTSQSTSSATTQGSGASGGSSTETIAWYGMMPHPYIAQVQKGVEAFEKDTGTAVYKKVGTEWTQNNETGNVEALSTQGYKGFSIFPGDPDGANGLYAELRKRGQNVIAYGGEPKIPTPASFTVATAIKDAAMTACESLIQQMGDKGNILDILETVTDVNTKLRKEGVEEVVAKHPNVKIIQTIEDMTELSVATNKIESTLAARGDEIDGMIATGYNPTVATARILAERHKDPAKKHIHFMGIDDDAAVISAIRDGSIDGTIAQNPFAHGYVPCMLLKLMNEGWTPKADYQFVNAGIVIVTRDNVDTYPADVRKITDSILADLKTKYLNAPK